MNRILSISMVALLLAIVAFAALESWVEIHTHLAQEQVQAREESDSLIVRTSPR